MISDLVHIEFNGRRSQKAPTRRLLVHCARERRLQHQGTSLVSRNFRADFPMKFAALDPSKKPLTHCFVLCEGMWGWLADCFTSHASAGLIHRVTSIPPNQHHTVRTKVRQKLLRTIHFHSAFPKIRVIVLRTNPFFPVVASAHTCTYRTKP